MHCNNQILSVALLLRRRDKVQTKNNNHTRLTTQYSLSCLLATSQPMMEKAAPMMGPHRKPRENATPITAWECGERSGWVGGWGGGGGGGGASTYGFR